MKSTTKFLMLLALTMMAGISAARAEEEPGFPIQANIETRQIHAVHTLRGMWNQPAVAMSEGEAIAQPILFANASDHLSPQDVAQVKKVAALLKTPAYKHHHVLVSGYTDNTGKNASNQRLSYHRAVMVMHALEKNGVPASQLTAQGFGDENPVADNSTASGRAQNRRVTFTLDNK